MVEELGDELLVYDPESDRAHCLGATAARVWKACDGETTVAGLATTLQLDADAVHGALEELTGCSLLQTGSEAPRGLTRRDLGIKVGKVGAAAASVPFVLSIAVPAYAVATPTVEECRAGFVSGCGDCRLQGCCCCGPAEGNTKDCVPTATCGVVAYPLAPIGSKCSKTN